MICDAVQATVHDQIPTFVDSRNASAAEPHYEHMSGIVSKFDFQRWCAAFWSDIDSCDRARNSDLLPGRTCSDGDDNLTGMTSFVFLGGLAKRALVRTLGETSKRATHPAHRYRISVISGPRSGSEMVGRAEAAGVVAPLDSFDGSTGTRSGSPFPIGIAVSPRMTTT